MNKQKATLSLETYYLPTTQNNIGVRNTINTSFTWSNINLRTLLGDMWDKYDYFDLTINEITTAPTTSVNTPTLQIRPVNLFISGLPFINSTYDAQLKHNTNKTLFTTFIFAAANAIATKNYLGANDIFFRKEQEQCDITITYSTVGNISIPDNLNFPHMTFIFSINGVQIDKDKQLDSRMNK